MACYRDSFTLFSLSFETSVNFYEGTWRHIPTFPMFVRIWFHQFPRWVSPKHACPPPFPCLQRWLWLQSVKTVLSKHPGRTLTSHASVQPSRQCGAVLCCHGNGFRKENNALLSNACTKLVYISINLGTSENPVEIETENNLFLIFVLSPFLSFVYHFPTFISLPPFPLKAVN
jgi:hypothetical protein